MEEALLLLVDPVGGDGFPSSSDTATGGVGLTDRWMVCGPPSEHLLQLLPSLPVDISPCLPLSAVHGENNFLAGMTVSLSINTRV